LVLRAEALASVPAAASALDTKMPIISAASVPMTTIRRLNLRQKSRGFFAALLQDFSSRSCFE